MLLGRDQRTVAPNVLRRTTGRWDGCRAESGEAAVDSMAEARKIRLSILREATAALHLGTVRGLLVARQNLL